jgi:hypothetical protein
MKKITKVAFDSEKNVQVIEVTEGTSSFYLEVEFGRNNGIASINSNVVMDADRLNRLEFSSDANEIASVVETLKETTKTLIDLF